MLTARLALVALVISSAPAAAQGLHEKISQLFIFGSGADPLFLGGSADVNNPASVRAHGAHFVPAAVSENASIIGFLSTAISRSIANAPIGSTSGGETFHFEAGVPVRTSTSSGPIFAERAQTLGRNRSATGIGRTTAHFSSLRGVPLDNIELFFTHENVDFAGCDSLNAGGDCTKMGIPNLENEIIQVNLKLDVKVQVTSIYATYGVTDNVDVGFVLPIVSTTMNGESLAQIIPFGGPTAVHFFGGTPTNPVLSASRAVSGSAVGLGDLSVRTKVSLRRSNRASISVLGEARFATGDSEDLLGAGAFAARGLTVMSAQFGSVAPHANIGYIYRAGDLQNDAVVAIAGFDHLMANRITIAADVVSELQVGRSKLHLPRPVAYQAPFVRTITPTQIPDIADDIVNGSLGFKVSTARGFTFVGNALVPLNRGGLRANISYTAGLEFSF
jgi:hypothetical protein